jgi:hypothetical protein
LFQRKDQLVVENSLRYSWFFFDIIVKSIAQLLGDTGKLQDVQRGTRVTPDFIQALAGLVSLLIRELHQLLPTYHVGHILNNSIALFIKVCSCVLLLLCVIVVAGGGGVCVCTYVCM